MSGPRTRAESAAWAERGGSSAFTFFELMLVLAIIAIVFIATIPLVGPSIRERKLREMAQDIQGIVRTERSLALSSGDRRLVEARGAGFFEKIGGKAEVLPLPKGSRLMLRLPGETKWEKPIGQPWEFSPIGLVTPYSVRLEDGEAWMEFDVDLLTGRVAEERYAF